MPDSNTRLTIDMAALLQSRHVSSATRKALEDKLQTPKRSGYFNDAQLQTLAAVSARLIPQLAGGPTVDLPLKLDAQLTHGKGKGWRYDILPPDEVLFKQGLDAIEKAAGFASLDTEKQDAFLESLQKGEVRNMDWPAEVQQRFFVELLAALTAIFYSHPIGRAEIGDLSFADLPNWQALGLNEEEPPVNKRVV